MAVSRNRSQRESACSDTRQSDPAGAPRASAQRARLRRGALDRARASVSRMKSGPEPSRSRAADAEANVEARVEEFPEGAATASDAARATGANLQEIVKSLLFMCDGRSVLVMVPGDRRADSDKIAKAVGCGDVKVAARAKSRTPPVSARGVAPFPLPSTSSSWSEPCWRMRSSGSGQEPAGTWLPWPLPTSSNWLRHDQSTRWPRAPNL